MKWDWAAQNGHLPVVTFLQKNHTEGCTTNAMECAMDWASQNGHLPVVTFLRVQKNK